MIAQVGECHYMGKPIRNAKSERIEQTEQNSRCSEECVGRTVRKVIDTTKSVI
jgi:hypothetical protein